VASIDGGGIDQATGTGPVASAVGAVEFVVPEWVRVRREGFGLLFYDTRSTKLTFVRSGDVLAPVASPAGRPMLRLPTETGSELSPVLSRLLENLVRKGLLVVAKAEH
jgi:putative mycofactocin binding protein MftB